jgi:acetyltransferase-like isoleucine patch superfamily enzyme
MRSGYLAVNGDVTIFRGTRILLGENACLEIGNGTYINFDSAITCFKQITIGANCAISWNTNIVDGNGHELVVDGAPRPLTPPVHIGDNV